MMINVLTKFTAGLSLLFIAMGCGSGSTTQTETTADTTQATAKATPTSATKQPVILFFGNSLTAGLGVEPEEAFPALVSDKVKAAGLNYQVVNAGLSGETSAGGKSRIGWVLRQPVAVFILELGGNDGLRGILPSATKQNLQAIIDSVKLKSPQAKIVIAGMQIQPNMGVQYTTPFRELFPALARENKAALIPFLLENVGGIPRLNQPDRIHPTAEGHKIVANTVWKTLEPLLKPGA